MGCKNACIQDKVCLYISTCNFCQRAICISELSMSFSLYLLRYRTFTLVFPNSNHFPGLYVFSQTGKNVVIATISPKIEFCSKMINTLASQSHHKVLHQKNESSSGSWGQRAGEERRTKGARLH